MASRGALRARPAASSADRVRIGRRRQRFLFLALLVFSARLGWAFIDIQIVGHDQYRDSAQKQQKKRIEIAPQRGEIFDRNGIPLAVNDEAYGVYVVPRHVSDVDAFVTELAEILPVDAQEIRRAVDQGGWYVRLARGVPSEAIRALEKAAIKGVGVETYQVRRYPHGDLASNLLGAVDVDNRGLDGLELFYDETLRGVPGYAIHQRDALGREYPNFTFPVAAPEHGNTVHLTIDLEIQEIVEQALDLAMERTRARTGSVVVVDPRTGEVLAIAARSTDASKPDEPARNVAVIDQFEPGSTFKVVTLTGLYEEGLAAPTDSLYCEDGTWRRAGRTIRDVHAYDHLSVEEVIEASSNICSVKLVERLGESRLYEYARKFGFGLQAGLDFPGEPRGRLKRPEEWSGLTAGSIAMGYEVMVTSMQMVMAYAAIANGGELYRPYLVRRILDTEGRVEFEARPQQIRRVMRPETSRLVRQALVRVVELGTARNAQLEMIPVAGKTGTARKVGENGRYDRSRFTSSFAGFFPAEDARYAVFVRIDEPVGAYYGGLVAAPVFREVMENTLITRAVDRSPGLVERFRAQERVVWKVSDGFGELPTEGVDPVESETSQETEEEEEVWPADLDPRTHVKVPDFEGMSLRQAVRRAGRLGLELELDGVDRIVRQAPEPGEVVPRGAVIRVFDR